MANQILNEEETVSLKKLFIPLTTIKIIHFLIIIGFLVFGNGLFNHFVQDDNAQIVDNTAITSLANIPQFFLESRLTTGNNKQGATYFKPLLDTTYTLTYSIFTLNYFGYHLFQLLVYIANSILVYLFLKKYFHQSLSFILALLFLIHPINSENALYIADTQEVLYLFFGMMSLLLLQKKTTWKYSLSAAFFIFLSVLSKETGALFLFPALMITFNQQKKQRTPMLISFFSTGILYALIRIHAIGLIPHSQINAPIGRLSIEERLLTMPGIILFYIKTFFFPYALSSSWQWTNTSLGFQQFIFPLFITLIFFLILFLFWSFKVKKNKVKSKLFLMFTIWIILGLLFHAQFLVLDQTAAERWFYFTFIGFLGIFGILLSEWKIKLTKILVVSICIILFTALGIRSFIRTFDYRNDYILATHDIKVSPDSYNLEYIISHEYYNAGMLEKAADHAKKSVALFPYITNLTNLGAVESRMGHYKEAHAAYLHALNYGSDMLPYKNLASLALVYGNPEENIKFIKNVALKKYPEDGQLWFLLALIEYTTGKKTDAKKDWEFAKKYNTASTTAFIDQYISGDKPLFIKVINGNVTFSSTK